MINAREELRKAHAARTEAESALESAQAATDRARSLLESIVREAEDHEASEMRVSSTLAADLKTALLAGAALPAVASDKELTKSAAARATLAARRQAAEEIVAELAEEQGGRERELSNATSAVEQAVRGVLLGEVESIGRDWAEIARKARAIRIKLGGLPEDQIWRLGNLSTTVGLALYQNREDREFDRPQGEAIASAWLDFASALITRPDAQLDFASADRALAALSQAREERRATDARFERRMRGEAA